MVGSVKRLWRARRLPVLALAAAAVAVLAYEAYPRRPPPRSVAELVDRLRASGMGVHVVPVNRATKGLEDGAFLCEGERPWEAVSLLRRGAEYLADWVGVVRAEHWPDSEWAVFFIHREWQGCSARVGDVLLFGDPELLRRIVDAMAR
jgi:hypothetical protein